MKKLYSFILALIIMCVSVPVTVFADDTVMLDGIVYSADMSTLINCTQKYSGDEEFSVPEGVSVISSGAFLDNSVIRTVYLPSTLKEIGADAFRSSKIEEVYIKKTDNFSKIGNCAFFGCENLKKVYLCSESVTDIGENVFKNCSSLTVAYLPDSLVSESAFIGCASLKYINLGENETACKTYGLGFMDANGNVTAANARSILRLAADIDLKLANVHLSADVNRDGKITAADARKILRVSARLEIF